MCHVITMLELGGAQQNTLYTCAHLDRERYDVLLVSGKGGILDKEALAADYRTYFVDDLIREIRPLRDLKAFCQLVQTFRLERPDIVHTHSSKAGIIGRLAAWWAGVPVVVHTFHGFGFHERQNPLLRFVLLAAEAASAAVSDALVFVSEANRRVARHFGLGDPSRHLVIRSGVKLGSLPAQVDAGRKKAELGVGMHKPLVLSIGNLKPQKHPEDFVRLAKAVSRTVPDARFVFVGDGELRTKVEAMVIREGLFGKVLFPGWRRDTAELLAAADVFVMTSLWEGLPRALVEAMRSGVAPVCYATDGVTDLIQDGETGFTARPGDWSGLAARVAQLLQDHPLRERLARKAAAAVGPEFDIDGMVRSQEALYRALLDTGRPPKAAPAAAAGSALH